MYRRRGTPCPCTAVANRREGSLRHRWKTLSTDGTWRRTREARPVWRKKPLAKLDTWAAEHGLPPEPFAKMKQAVIALFVDMERKGELD